MTEHTQTVSAFLAAPDAVERGVASLVERGVPRDLVEVIVSPEANRAHYGGRARRLGTQTVRYAGAGALLGLLAGVVLSLEIILVFPGFEPPARELSIGQLLGPNVGMMIGLVIGALIGFFVKRRSTGPLARIRGREDILIAVRAVAPDRVEAITAALADAGGREIETAPERRRRSRWW